MIPDILWLCSWYWKVSGLDTSTHFKLFWVQPLSKDYGWLPLLPSQKNLIKVVEFVTFMPGFGSLQESMVLCRGRGSVSYPLHQELLQIPAGHWGTLVGDTGTDGVSMCMCHSYPRQWRFSDVCLSDWAWEECGMLGCWSSWKIIRQAGLRDLFSTSPCCNFFGENTCYLGIDVSAIEPFETWSGISIAQRDG